MNGSMTNDSKMMMNHHEEAIADVGYSIGFSLAILFVLIIISYISYKCNRYSSSPTNHNITTTNTTINGDGDDGGVVGVSFSKGLDEATLVNCPKFMYSQVKMGGVDSSSSGGDRIVTGCSICLVDYKDYHMIRMLPDCGHIFHLKCIDPWLKLHPSCPICRSTPLSTPSATPLAQMVPLSRQQI